VSDVRTEEKPAEATESAVVETEETAAVEMADEGAHADTSDEADSAEPAVEEPAEETLGAADPGPLEGLRAAVIAGCEGLNQTC